jgi:type IV pilus assembly protein PilY1
MNFSSTLFFKVVVGVVAVLGYSASIAAPATGPLNLTNIPLANATTSNVKPNLMFIFDDSSSMDDAGVGLGLPDLMSATGTYGSGTPHYFRNNAFNGIAYNPAVTYEKPAYFNADGTVNNSTYPSQSGADTAAGADASAKPNWRQVRNNYYDSGDGTSNLEGNAYYYTVIPGEYCKERDFKDCIAATAVSGAYKYPASLRWCNASGTAIGPGNPAVNACQAIQNTIFNFPRYPTPNQTTITVNAGTGATTVVNGITADGQQILSAATVTDTNTTNLAIKIRDNINKCTSIITGSCTVSGYAALSTGNVVTIVAPKNAAIAAPSISKTPAATGLTFTSAAFANVVSTNNAPGVNRLVVITPAGATNAAATTVYTYPGTSTVSGDRTDCTGTCSYAKEMENYANWWAYYHIRLQAMKTSVSRAFKGIDSRYRVGFTNINNKVATNGYGFLNIGVFQTAHKKAWYDTLFSVGVGGNNTIAGTPLRASLSKVARLFANKSGLAGAVDPVEYSCQQNFAILSTDGFWNSFTETGGYTPKKLDGSAIGDHDKDEPLPRKDVLQKSNTLADVAEYYYDTDLRTAALGNCTGALGLDVCNDNVFVSDTDTNQKQHMVTFTMAFGINDRLNFTSDYLTATSGDYYKLKTGTGVPATVWPDPNIADTTTITGVPGRGDDLWHAAVNGRGVYFSARRPDEIVAGFQSALNSIAAKVGSGAAAATSTLTPVAGDNSLFLATYTTGKWIGNLEARTISASFTVSEAASWCVENVVADTCPSPGVVSFDSGANKYFCTTSGVSVEIATSCTGTLQSKVGVNSDTRKIWTSGPNAATLNNFKITGGDLNPADFNATKLATLAQWPALTGTQQTAAVGDGIVNYLRGQTGFENRASNLVGAVDNRLFRFREATMGDTVESRPLFVGKPLFNYSDSGYSGFKSANAGRAKTVYIGANDGMLHAFDATNGQERWAFVPSMVIPDMFALADEAYSNNHMYLVNGSPVYADVKIGGSWRSIIVAGLNGGGRGYYALDVTDPEAPTLLWEFKPSDDNDLGFTFGEPVITKKSDGSWVVLVTSGYNNIPDTSPRVRFPKVNTGNGRGYLYVLDVATGTKLSKIGTGEGSAALPSGLAQISVWNNDAEKNNTAVAVYGGDLLGNVWRFDIDSGSAMKFAELKDSSGTAQPITTKLEGGKVTGANGKSYRTLFMGTGKYLEVTDLVDTQQNTVYGIKDDNASSTFVNPRVHNSGSDKMVQQTLTTVGAERTASTNVVDIASGRGWFVNFPASGERVNIAPQLALGNLIMPTVVPSSSVCAPGGTGWVNYFNYKTGGSTSPTNKVSSFTNAPLVGINIFYEPEGSFGGAAGLGSDGKIIKPPTPTALSVGGTFQGKRGIWRELVR